MKKLMLITLSITCLPFSLNAGKKQTPMCIQEKDIVTFIFNRKKQRMQVAMRNTAIELAPNYLSHLHTTIAPHK